MNADSGMRMMYVIITAVFVLFLPDLIHAQAIVNPPKDVTEKKGGTAIFECEVDFGQIEAMNWESNSKIIYSYLNGKEDNDGANKSLVEKTENKFILSVRDLEYADGGIYACAATVLQEKAVLIVLGEPSLTVPSTQVEGDTALYTCEAEFGGPSADKISPGQYPKLQMWMPGHTLEEIDNMPTNEGRKYHLQKTYRLTLNVTMHGKPLICEIETVSPAVKVHSSTDIYVMQSVRNVQYSPAEMKYKIGSNITCTADGHPSPSFEWSNLARPETLIKGNWLEITDDMKGEEMWMCVARNSIGNETYEANINVTFTAVTDFEIDSSGKGSSVHIIIIIIIILLCAFGVIVGYKYGRKIYYNIWRRLPQRNNRPQPKNAKNDANQNLPDAALPLLKRKDDPEDRINIDKGESQPLSATSTKSCTPSTSQTSDDGYSTKPKCPDVVKFMEVIETLNGKEVMEEHGEFIQHTVENYKQDILKNHPDIALRLIEKATHLIKSPLYATTITLLTEGDNDGQSRNKCLRALVFQSEYVSKPENHIEWSPELIDLLERLLQLGADPTWIPTEDLPKFERKDRYTAQDRFFSAIAYILLHRNELVNQLEKAVSSFLSPKSKNHKELRGTALHAMMGIDWKVFIEKLGSSQSKFFLDYKNFIAKIKNHNTAAVDETDWSGKTPLQLFIASSNLLENIFENAAEIALLLKSRNNVSRKDNSGKTSLHYFADCFPVFYKTVSPAQKSAFIDFAKALTCDVSSCLRDEKGSTVLHILATKYGEKIPEYCCEMFFELVKIFSTMKSNVDIQDNQGCTALHLLAEKYPKQRSDHFLKVYKDVMKYLASEHNTNFQDKQGHTILHVLADSYDIDMPKPSKEMFMELMKFFRTKLNIDVTDKEGNTMLHILAKKYCWKASVESTKLFMTLMKYFYCYANICITNDEGKTVLHTLVCKYTKDMTEDSMKSFYNLVIIFPDDSNVDIPDSDGYTVLHTLVEKYPQDVPEHNVKKYVQLLKYLAWYSKRKVPDHKGRTVSDMLAEKYNNMPKHCHKTYDKLQDILKKKEHFWD